MESLTQEITPAAEGSDPEDDVDIPPPVPKIRTLRKLFKHWRMYKIFLQSHNCFEMSTKTNTLINEVTAYQASTMRQTTLMHFFPRNEYDSEVQYLYNYNNDVYCTH